MVSNFLGRVFVSAAVLCFGYYHFILETSGQKNAQKTYAKTLLLSKATPDLQGHINQHYDNIWLGLSYALMGAPIIIIFRQYAYIALIAYITINLQKFNQAFALPRHNLTTWLDVASFLATDLGVIGALLLATVPGKKN